jgi:hypothetical protein
MPCRFALLPALLALLVVMGGCGKPMPQIAEVEGTVTIKGKPQSRLLVRFLPDPDKGNNWPVNGEGQTDDKGKFQLKYHHAGQEGLGAAVGWNRILIEDTRLSGLAQGQPRPPQIIPVAYNSPATTPLSKEVKPGKQTIDLEVGN